MRTTNSPCSPRLGSHRRNAHVVGQRLFELVEELAPGEARWSMMPLASRAALATDLQFLCVDLRTDCARHRRGSRAASRSDSTACAPSVRWLAVNRTSWATLNA